MNRRYDPDVHRRGSVRLRGYDYSQAGAYFVTIVTQDRLCLFGDVVGGTMRLNGAGRLAQEVWEGLPRRFPGIGLDAFVVMPNHVHGIIVIDEPVGASLVGAQEGDHAGMSDQERATTRVAPTLGDVVGGYKSIVTVEYGRGVRANEWQPFRGRLWQRNYYEHVIRDDEELGRAREYIVNNPLKWELDSENPWRKGRPRTAPTGGPR